MNSSLRQRAPWSLWPVAALGDLLAAILRLTGRLLAVLIGLVLMVVGAAATATLVGAPVGLPLFVVGLMLTVRGIF